MTQEPATPAAPNTGRKRKWRKGQNRGHRQGLWRPRFLEALAAVPNVRVAAMAAGVDKGTVERHRAKDPAFAQQWDDALDQAVDMLEARVFQRAQKSDTLAIFLLKSWRRERYGEVQRHEVTGDGGGPVTFRVIYEDRKTLTLPAQGIREVVVEQAPPPAVNGSTPGVASVPGVASSNGHAAEAVSLVEAVAAEPARVCAAPGCKKALPAKPAQGPLKQTCSTACRMRLSRARQVKPKDGPGMEYASG